MIGPDNSGEKLGIIRLGGHIEENESLLQSLEREIKEEGSIEVKLFDSPCTFYIRNWDVEEHEGSINLIKIRKTKEFTKEFKNTS